MEIYKPHRLLPIRKARRVCAAEAQGFQDFEIRTPDFWGIYNSPLVPTGNDTITSYQQTLVETLPESQQWLSTYIQDLKTAKVARTGNPQVSFKGLDLFGQGTMLFSEFTPHTFTLTVSNSLTDQRPSFLSLPLHAANLRKLDRSINNRFVPGDYFDPSTRQKIGKKLEHTKVDVIFMKAIGGIKSMPRNPYLIAEELQYLWGMLEDEGVMFVQVLPEMRALVQPWLDTISTLEKIDGKMSIIQGKGIFLRLNRHTGAPDQLPFLSRQDVMQILQQSRLEQKV